MSESDSSSSLPEHHDPTLLAPSDAPGSSPSAPSSPTGGEPIDGSRFAPGAVLAGRYRLVARLGRGGMGEVYRVEDLKLGETVALKFLPPRLSLDANALARFHREVRVSRQISHRNVCRVFDIAEADGLAFLTMEYIDGEDLSSLLRRIGRLPETKAAEIAQQVCSGLAAAHEAGILHRDLKPANVMIDGRGRAKITDFGLAHLVDELQESGELAGTPAYLAPEQFRGEPASVGTDLYALGLVLYEMFTGTKAFENEDWLSLLRRGGRSGPPSAPSEHVPSLDPIIDDALLAVLADDPAERPGSALEVAASLPGGDPLAAALAAGETPSPEMVASVRDHGVLDRRLALGGACLVLLLLVAAQALGKNTLLGLVEPTKSPAVLIDRAQQVLREIGHETPGVDRVGAYRFEKTRIDGAAESTGSIEAWRERAPRRPMLLTYWYRQAPAPLLPWRIAWIPEPFDPPPIAGEAFVVLDARGRLEELRIEPIGSEPSADSAAPTDWRPLFRAAELDLAVFREVTVPDSLTDALPAHDSRRAWIGESDSGETLRVDAATLAGSPVYFSLGDGTPTVEAPATSTPIPTGQGLLMVTFFLLMAAALVLTHRHLRRGRADRRGAGVLGASVAVASLVGLFAGAHHPPTDSEFFFLRLEILEATTFRGAAVVLVYLALEPLIRRRAPEVLVTSTRLLAGRWRDPRVGRDLLAGLALGVGATVACGAAQAFLPIFGDRPLAIFGLAQKLAGVGGTLYWMTFSFFLAVSSALLLCLLYALLVAWWRRRLLAGLGLFAVTAAIGGFSPIACLGALLFVVCLVRFGILATIALWLGVDWVLLFPSGAQPGDWWLALAMLPSLALALLAIAAAWTATGAAVPLRLRWSRSRAGRGSRATFSASRGRSSRVSPDGRTKDQSYGP